MSDVAQKEKHRADRVRVYAAKRDSGFNCDAEDCNATNRLLACQVADGTVIVRCPRHRGSAKPLPGQWDEAERVEEQLRR